MAADSSHIVTVASRGKAISKGPFLPFFLPVPASKGRLQPVSERAICSDKFSCLVPHREASEPEGEAMQAVVQLCCRRRSPDYSLIGHPEGSCGMSRFLVHELLGAVDSVPFPTQLRPEERCRLDTCRLNSSAVSGDRPAWPKIILSLLCAFLAIFGLVLCRSFKVSCESSHTPNHRVVCLLEWIVLSPTWMRERWLRWPSSSAQGDWLHLARVKAHCVSVGQFLGCRCCLLQSGAEGVFVLSHATSSTKDSAFTHGTHLPHTRRGRSRRRRRGWVMPGSPGGSRC